MVDLVDNHARKGEALGHSAVLSSRSQAVTILKQATWFCNNNFFQNLKTWLCNQKVTMYPFTAMPFLLTTDMVVVTYVLYLGDCQIGPCMRQCLLTYKLLTDTKLTENETKPSNYCCCWQQNYNDCFRCIWRLECNYTCVEVVTILLIEWQV